MSRRFVERIRSFASRMRRVPRARAACVATALSLGACGDDAPTAIPLESATRTGWRVRLASALPARVEPFRELDAPLTFEVVDGTGRPVRGVSVRLRVATGLVNLGDRSDAGSAWFPAPALGTFVQTVTDARGCLAIRWIPDGEPTQRLVVGIDASVRDTFVVDTNALVLERPLARATVPLAATQVAPAGAHVTCVLVGARVGCLGHRQFVAQSTGIDGPRWAPPRWDRSDVPTLALGEPRWLEFPGTPVRVLSMRGAACAVLRENARLACWRDLGPAGPVPIADQLPPLRVVERDMGIDSTGTAGFITHGPGDGIGSPSAPDTAQPVMRWVPLPSDVPIVRPGINWSGFFFCGVTATDALRCAWRAGRRTDANDSRLLPVRFPDGSAVRARQVATETYSLSYENAAGQSQLAIIAPDGSRMLAVFRQSLGLPIPVPLPLREVYVVQPDWPLPIPGEGTAAPSMGRYGEFLPRRGGYSSGADRRCESAGVVVCTWRLGMDDTAHLRETDTIRVLAR